jgi:hypothetical protein
MMSGFPRLPYSYTLGQVGQSDPPNQMNGFASVLEPAIKLEPQRVFIPAAIFEPTPIDHGIQHVQPRPVLKLAPITEPRARIHPPAQYVPGVTYHTPDKILPGHTYTQRDEYAPRPVIQLRPRLELETTQTCCACETQQTIKPSPFVAPWELLPDPDSPAQNGARQQIKLAPDCSDVTTTGHLVDLFL